MDQIPLVEAKIKDAIALVKVLDEQFISPSLVMWYFYDDAGDWRLLLAGKEYDKIKEQNLYMSVSKSLAVSDVSTLEISDIKFIKMGSPLQKTASMLMRTPADVITRAEFTTSTINGIFIKHMIILRSAGE